MINKMPLDKFMRKSGFAAIVLFLLIATALAQTASTPASRTQTSTTSTAPNGFRAGHILVRFKTTPAQAVLDQLNSAFGAKAVGKIAEIEVMHLKVPPQAGLALLEHLRQWAEVNFA